MESLRRVVLQTVIITQLVFIAQSALLPQRVYTKQKRSLVYSNDYPECNGEIRLVQASEGVITSPGYPAPYPHGVYCRYKIIGDEGLNLRLLYTFMAIDEFECRDSVTIYGDSLNSSAVVQHCQIRTPKDEYVIDGNVAYVVFETDNEVTSLGFVLTFQSEPNVTTSAPTTMDPTTSSTIATDDEQTTSFISTSKISTVSSTTKPTTSFISSSKISTVASTKEPTTALTSKISTVASTTGPTTSIKSTSIPVHETTTNANQVPCDSTTYIELPGNSGTLTSPNYPRDYPDNTRCKWKIVGSSNQHIKLRARSFDLELTDNCYFDYVKLKSSAYRTLATYCGYLVEPQSVYMPSSSAYIEFKSDSDGSGKGFAIDYEKIDLCQSPMIITEPSGRLGTPGFFWDGTGTYDSSMNCGWRFQARDSQVVVLHLNQIDIELGFLNPCDSDVLKVYDGSSASSALLQQICNTGIVDLQYKSSGSYMFMQFTTDSSVNHNGFEFTWEFREKDDEDTFIINHADGCDGGTLRLTGDSGSISSPLTSLGKYPVGVTCRYSIIATTNKDAALAFSTFDLEDDPTCAHDWVKVYDGTSASGTLLGTYCGTHAPAAITSTSHTFYIEFHSDSTLSGTGFTANFGTKNEVDLSVCGITHIDPSPFADTKIVGGDESHAHSLPWMALMWISYEGNIIPWCGGAIIGDQWILTAAHCTEDLTAGHFLVTVGEHDLATIDEVPQEEVYVDQIIQHPNYNSETIDSDISLLKLKTPLTYSFGRRRVCLPGDDVRVGETCWIAGWGQSEGTADNIYRLNQAKVDIISTSTCNAAGWLDGLVNDNMFCAGFAEGGVDTCQGDSGGPLVCENDGVFTQYGIVSFGAGCADKKRPGVYTRLYNYIDWVHQHIGSNP